MRERKIPKRDGSYRTVVMPSRDEKARLRAMLPRLQALAMLADTEGVAHGFTPTRSPVTNAAQHVGYRITLSWDVASCFDRLTVDLVASATVPDKCYYQGIARQGLPTSPTLCNLALAPLDRRIMELLRAAQSRGLRAVYTRYADDLTISCDDQRLANAMREAIPQLCQQHGMPINPRKTQVQYARAGRRHVTGVAVDDTGIHPTRAAKRRLRAARHQGRRAHARGLAEWCRLTPPRALRWMEGHDDDRHAALRTLVAAQHHGTAKPRRTHT